MTTYRLRQRFRYTYDGPATDLVHRLVAVPPARHGDQRLVDRTLTVSAPGAVTRWETDGFGNTAATVRVPVVPATLDFELDVTVERSPGASADLPAAALTDRRWLDPTPLTAADAEIQAVAGRLDRADPLAFARLASTYVRGAVRYTGGSTHVGTTAAAALAGGHGVCQDQAHVLVALCRAAGVPARYVSGHLLGEGRTHAWAEVLVAGGGAAGGGAAGGGGAARAVAVDPCHDRLTDGRYVTVAVGRDYRDVPPTSGWYSGAAQGVLSTTTSVEPVSLATTDCP